MGSRVICRALHSCWSIFQCLLMEAICLNEIECVINVPKSGINVVSVIGALGDDK